MRFLSALLIAAFATSLALGDVDAGKRNEDFAPKASEQPRVEKERTEVGDSQPARDGTVQFITVPASDARASKPRLVEKQRASVSTTAVTVPARKPGSAAISTSQKPSQRFDKKYDTTTVARIQESMGEANRVTSEKTKAAAKPSVIERINRFVFRKNEPPPSTAPAGGGNGSAEGPEAESPSSGS